MRSLVAVLRSKLTEKITKQRAELDRLEQADSFTLKAVN
jgi:hypothetical protein